MNPIIESKNDVHNRKKELKEPLTDIFPKDVASIITEYAIIPKEFDIYKKSEYDSMILCTCQHKKYGALIFTLRDEARGGSLEVYLENYGWQPVVIESKLLVQNAAVWNDSFLICTNGQQIFKCINIQDNNFNNWCPYSFINPPKSSHICGIIIRENHCYLDEGKYIKYFILSVEEDHVIFNFVRCICVGPYIAQHFTRHPSQNKLFVQSDDFIIVLDTMTDNFNSFCRGSESTFNFYDGLLYLWSEKNNCIEAVDPINGQLMKCYRTHHNFYRMYFLFEYLLLESCRSITIIHIGNFS